MESAPAAANDEEALALLSDTLNQVEDELSGMPFEPENWRNDGRIYPPENDNLRIDPEHPDLRRYRSRGHNTWIGPAGAILIQDLESGSIVLDKPGANGCKINLT